MVANKAGVEKVELAGAAEAAAAAVGLLAELAAWGFLLGSV